MKHESISASAGAPTAGNGAPIDGSGDGAQSAVARDFHAFLRDFEHLVSSAASVTGEEFVRAKAELSARISAARTSVGRACSDSTNETAAPG
jgi:hypothetical protein